MLHLEVTGEGPDLVLVHGWGMHGGVWSEWVAHLSQRFRLHLVDLPGHGHSPYEGEAGLQEWASAVLEVAPQRAHWLGWSLGGLVTLEAASQDVQRFDSLTLLASTPRFVRAEDWPMAVDVEIFEQFSRQLATDVQRTLMRFLSLQVRGSEHSAGTLRRLRSELARRPQPDPAALRCGLHILQHSDLRRCLDTPALSVFCLLGERDTLIPVGTGHAFADIACAVISGAGHAPFLSHPQQCGEQLKRWLLPEQECPEHAAG